MVIDNNKDFKMECEIFVASINICDSIKESIILSRNKKEFKEC